MSTSFDALPIDKSIRHTFFVIVHLSRPHKDENDEWFEAE